MALTGVSLAITAAEEPSAPAAAVVPDLSQSHPFGVHDLVRMERLGTPVPSPDGAWVVFTVRSWNPESNKATTNLLPEEK